MSANNVESVVKTHRCISCGMCKSSCPVNAISLVYKDDGFFHPQVDESMCIHCKRCIKMCPAEHHIRSSSLTGDYLRLCLAHSTDTDVRYSATSGGVINSLLRYILNNNIVDAVLLTRYSNKAVIEAEPVILTRENSVCLKTDARDFASRYVTVPVLADIAKYCGQFDRLAVVGTPCQINALTLLMGGGTSNQRFLKIGITCSGGMSYKATEEYKRCQQLESSAMYYRGNGWPGKNSLIANDRIIEYSHQGSLFERMFSSQIFKNPGCRNCVDHFAEKADISFCDFWDKQELSTEKNGNSCVFIRSHRAQEIFSGMEKGGYVEVARGLTEKEVIDTQYKILLAKKGTIRETLQYHVFMDLVDLIFKHKIYRFFSKKMYSRFCLLYSRMCEKTKI